MSPPGCRAEAPQKVPQPSFSQKLINTGKLSGTLISPHSVVPFLQVQHQIANPDVIFRKHPMQETLQSKK